MYSYIQTFCVIPNNLAVIQDESFNNLLKKICDNLYYNTNLKKNELINKIVYYHYKNETKIKIQLPEITGVIIGRNLSFKYIKNYNYVNQEENLFNNSYY